MSCPARRMFSTRLEHSRDSTKTCRRQGGEEIICRRRWCLTVLKFEHRLISCTVEFSGSRGGKTHSSVCEMQPIVSFKVQIVQLDTLSP